MDIDLGEIEIFVFYNAMGIDFPRNLCLFGFSFRYFDFEIRPFQWQFGQSQYVNTKFSFGPVHFWRKW